MSTRTISASTCSHPLDAPADRVDLAEWLYSLPDDEYRRCCPTDNLAAGLTTTEAGTPVCVMLGMLGEFLMIQRFVGEVTGPHYCRLVSASDVIFPLGRTTVHATWELRIEPTEDRRCTLTSRTVLSPTSEYFAFLDEHGITFENAAKEWQGASNAHHPRETRGFAESIARHAAAPNGRHAAESVPPVIIRRGTTEIGQDTDAAKAIVRRSIEEVQIGGDFELFEQLFADDYVDHTPSPGHSPDRAGTRLLYESLRAAVPDLRADIQWQAVDRAGDGARVTTYVTYRGTQQGPFDGAAATGQRVSFGAVEAMQVRGGRIVEHWGVPNLLSVRQQLA